MMKVLRMILLLAVVLTTALSVEAQKKGEKTVVFNANLHCESCKAKVEKNLPFEKGVKDLKVDMKAQTITVTFKEDKNSADQLRKAIEKLNIEVKSCDATCGQKNKSGESCCGDKKKEGCQGEKKECCRKEKK